MDTSAVDLAVLWAIEVNFCRNTTPALPSGFAFAVDGQYDHMVMMKNRITELSAVYKKPLCWCRVCLITKRILKMGVDRECSDESDNYLTPFICVSLSSHSGIGA